MNTPLLELPKDSHDLRLPEWGPYSKKYFGVSHVCTGRHGLRFDVCAVPGRFRYDFYMPDALKPSGYLPWDTSPDLLEYSYRQQMGAPHQVYAEISFENSDDREVSVKVRFENKTSLPESLCLHFCAWMNFPPSKPRSDEVLRMARVILPQDAVWVDALSYESVDIASQKHAFGLVEDAAIFGEARVHGFVDGQALGLGFGRHPEDRVTYKVPPSSRRGVIRLRSEENCAECELVMGSEVQVIQVANELSATEFKIPEGTDLLQIRPRGGMQLDGIAFLQTSHGEVQFQDIVWDAHPEIRRKGRRVELSYKNVPGETYWIEAEDDEFWLRSYLAENAERGVHMSLHNHVEDVIDLGADNQIIDLFFGPISVLAGENKELKFRLGCDGHEVKPVYKSTVKRLSNHPEGDAYAFGYERMRSVVLTNVVYPVRVEATWARHSTPGRWWDCLYTWDSGFIGMGLIECDVKNAVDCLNAYYTKPDDPYNAFVHHGSMVPTQIYLFKEIWNRTQDRRMLERFYPRALRQYRFISGKDGKSRTGVLKSGLLKTWDYFYNSGGWDDYPPQHYLRSRIERRDRTTPVITTSHIARCARILAELAEILGEDNSELLEDEKHLSEVLLKYSWTEKDGVFSYVEHDEKGEPFRPLISPGGDNFNLGLDGMSPLFALDLPRAIRGKILGAIFDPERFWTKYGLTEVDRTASYAKKDGYWNGTIWIPYQFLFWRALLDLGEGDKAHELARTALTLWEREVRSGLICAEHFILETGRGCGWHHFSGLSSPILNWFASYYSPGVLTVGHNAVLLEVGWGEEAECCSFLVRVRSKNELRPVLLASMKYGEKYKITGNVHSSREIHPALLEITLPASHGDFSISIEPQ